MTILVTGAAGFIGYHVCQQLLSRNETVIGLDNLNDYYDVLLKQARLEQLEAQENFTFYKIDISDKESVEQLTRDHPDITQIINLAAQAGVRYSLTHPHAYTESNITGYLNILEACRKLPIQHLVYASSSSVYGANTKLPFSIQDPVNKPISLYAATKRSNELFSYTYSHLFNIPATGLRFFTVYGPWGRPDMSAFLFTKAILKGEEISVFNHGDMKRNFTYIDDIVDGVIRCLDTPPNQTGVPHRLYNIGNNQPAELMEFIQTLEKTLNTKAKIRFEDMQPGDVKETVADISETTKDFGFLPKTNIEEGLKHFVDWYRDFYSV